ncbi:MAG: hypothetical protein IKF38_00995 [Clostridia bacterium]|nr:hypothetical protein [Clostridia bacterium]
MTNEQTKRVYSEIYSILDLLGKNYINKLPTKLYQLISNEKNQDYIPQYTMDISLEKQNIMKETLALLALFRLNYWCTSNMEKDRLKNNFLINERLYLDELKNKYNPDMIFKNNKKQIEKTETKENIKDVSLVKYKENIFTKILNKIKSILKRK